ncbi:MAG: multifunctional oxoglutarate decarboxylase/oxoglutarate dehydrogenase thiamine pyrophosphate-binding subunit/dihydrolipoyllysine-residue succinyltransferase subunit [Planctomycetes bacterium]|nr:multifunctional oxoglutarate decarboxylase/oxoglutarate dehydrogenase thiamine pyrophosphate-binding subunit/dihydrolipoyllysine-residue succinyltransferase subunit [Planctomycetota bacterium]
MAIDFEEQFGINAGYVESLYESWREDAGSVDPQWASYFASADATSAPPQAGSSAPPPRESDEDFEVEALRGVAAKIAANMNASLSIPTATTVRTLPVKALEENRRIVNGHMRDRVLGKASYTHFIAFAMVKAVAEMPSVQSFFEEKEGQGYRVTPRRVNIGLAIDVEGRDGRRSLVVPNIKGAESMNFKEFFDAYQDLVARGRHGKLTAADFAETTFTLTNPGGFGTEASVPRLMEGQGLILATGSIGLPVQARQMNPAMLADIAMGPVMTVTSTYDHRTVQGAESGRLLARIEQLLDGQDGFWDDIFRCLRVPWRPAVATVDQRAKSKREQAEDQAKVWQLIGAYRSRGCQLADLDPLEYKPDLRPSLDPEWYGFTIWDLDREFLTGGMGGQAKMTLREILTVLREAYCRRWTPEYMHIVDRTRKHWVRDRVEERRSEPVYSPEHRQRILERLVRAENFERFLQTRYPGNKRFSGEGADSMIPALAEIFDLAAEDGVERIVIGMAHRGRLTLLATLLNRPYERLFREFEGVLLPGEAEGSGDVKYHLGQRGTYVTPGGKEVEIILTANPSHLEAVDPVVCGQVRAYQDDSGDVERRKTLGVLIHGDAAFTGQGVVAETLQMSALRGYETGGTIHLIVNNQIGFTAGPQDLHSAYYCSDLAKMVQAPILHANGDYPESVVRACTVATEYQREHGADVVIDMVCYRRRGHNEGDEPMYTQPLLYKRIGEHPTVRENYTALLVRRGQMTREECEAIGERFDQQLREALEVSKGRQAEAKTYELAPGDTLAESEWSDDPSPETGIDTDRLVALIDELNSMPEGHVVHPNLLRQLKRREEMVRGNRGLDWGCAEALAFGTMIQDGIPMRMTGQDSGRGTFSHRHAVIRDQSTGEDYLPLADLNPEVSVQIYDSLLSEEAVLAFEYGYCLAHPETMVYWEAQFGDFANGAQIPIDQFITAGEAKWDQRVGLTMLLPHGHDGQGPEHSSARIERFLQLAAEGNIQVAAASTPAQCFHLLRRQGLAGARRKPLILFTPKSLLRDPRATSPIESLGEGRFQELIPDPQVTGGAREVVLCMGKIYFDAVEQRDAAGRDDLAIFRLEQFYPFPRKALLEALEAHPDARLTWLQEEPRNQGVWPYLQDRLSLLGLPVRYHGRPAAATPASGSYARHVAEQEQLLARLVSSE